MDEQRIQDYVALIEQQLGCTKGQYCEILPEQGGWINPRQLEVMRYVSDWLEREGKPYAGWLRHVAEQLAETMQVSPEEPQQKPQEEIQAALNFLAEVMQQIATTQGSQKVIYGFWRANVGKLNEHLVAALPIAFARVFKSDQPPTQEFIAGMFGEFGTLIQQFPWGDRKLNLEMAIVAYKLALRVYHKESFPERWAMTQNNLATAYSDRIQGDREDNLERAITAYRHALQVYSREAFPEQWAMTQNNLATAYSDRIQGNREDNLAAAILSYQLALHVYTHQKFPQQWAMTQDNLAAAYNAYSQQEREKYINN